MFLFAIAPVDHTETGHAKWSTILVNRDGVWDRAGTSPLRVEVDKGTDIPSPAKPIGGIVVMSRVQAEIPDGDIRIYGLKFPERNNNAYTIMASGIQKTDMKREVSANIGIMEAEHIKGMPEIENLFVAVPSPVSIRVREMAFTRAVVDTVYRALANFMSIRGSMGMDTGAVTGKGKTVFWDKTVF